MSRLKHGPPGESGQVLILFTIMIVVFLGFCALVVDVGRGYAERRYMQNGADAGALKVASLAAAQMPCDGSDPRCVGGLISSLTEVKAQQAAEALARSNGSLMGGYSAPVAVTVQYRTWNAGACTSAFQTVNPASSAYLPGGTCLIRVTARSSWTSWFPIPTSPSSFSRQPVEAAASASAAIRGVPEAIPGPTWPMVRRWGKIRLTEQDPPDNPYVFWDSNVNGSQNDDGGSNWKAVVNLGLNSDLGPYSTPAQPKRQPIEPAKNPGNTAVWYVNTDRSCTQNVGFSCGTTWNSWANDFLRLNQFVQNDYPRDPQNWFYYGWNGTLSYGAGGNQWWAGNSQGLGCGGVDNNCQVPSSFPPSQYNTINNPPAAGDWVETYSNEQNPNQNIGGGNLGNNIMQELLSYIDRHGYQCPFSDVMVPKKSYTLGKCVVMNIYLWEGGQVYDPKSNTWSGWKNGVPSRVHIVDMRPFAFYYNLVAGMNNSEINGFWISNVAPYMPPGGGGAPNSRMNYYFMVGEG